MVNRPLHLTEPEPAERRFSQVKRNGTRTPSRIPVILEGQDLIYSASVSDISRSGMLLEVTDSDLVRITPGESLNEFGRRVLSRFRWGMQVHFFGGVMRARALVVRVSQRGEDPDSGVLLGCRFCQPIPRPHCALLGIADA